MVTSPWVWDGPTNLLLRKRERPKWWDVISTVSLQMTLTSIFLYSFYCLLGLQTLMKQDSILEKPMYRGTMGHLQPTVSEKLRPSVRSSGKQILPHLNPEMIITTADTLTAAVRDSEAGDWMKPYAAFYPKVLSNNCCLKPLHFGVTFYAGINNFCSPDWL